MTHLRFYFRHALTHLRGSGHWTTFAVFCVAAGVATVVALRSLGLAIGDSLLSNLRLYNHGDISISRVGSFGPFSITFHRGPDETSVFQPEEMAAIQAWADAREIDLSPYTVVSNIQLTPQDGPNRGRPQFVNSYLIDPLNYDRPSPIVTSEPAGARLPELLAAPYTLVISQNLAEAHALAVGDAVRVSGSEQPFTVAGIVPTDVEASINNILASFFGFVYFHTASAEVLGLSSAPNFVGFTLPDGATPEQIEAAALELGNGSVVRRVRDINATPWLLARNETLADMVGRFIVTMALGALLIGGVGIMNTMLVLVGRRTMEIAALKTFGLKARQVAMIFLTEAFLLGVAGSLLGILAGLGLSRLVNSYGEAFLQQRLPWRLYPESVIYGLALGLVVTMVFGVLPVLTASRVRPSLVLRPNELHLPRAGVLQSLLSLLVIVVVLGAIAGQILTPILDTAARGRIATPNPLLLGVVVVAGTLLVLGALTAVMWAVVWLIGRLPTGGQVDLRLALRNLSTRRLRTATTLLALTAGMFALSSITYFGLGAREIVRFQFAQTLGGNVLMAPLLPYNLAEPLTRAVLATQPGVQYRTVFDLIFAQVAGVNGEPITLERMRIPFTAMMRDTNNPNLTSGVLRAGRDLTPEDRGQRVVVLAEQSFVTSAAQGFSSLADLGIEVGSTITLNIRRQAMDFEVIGIVTSANQITPSVANAFLPPGIDGLRPNLGINVIQVEEAHLDSFLATVTALPLTFATDVGIIDGLMSRLVEQLAAIPTIVGLLSLLAAAVIMANTVALTMLERRHQIGVLKTIGLKRGRVLRIVLLENTVISLVGALLGLGLSALGVAALTILGAGAAIPIPQEATWTTLGLVAAAVGIAWLATLLSARVAIGERAARILRYE